MSNINVNFLEHILHEINFILNETENVTFSKFLESEKDQKAITRSFEIIGEAIKNLPQEFRDQHPTSNWKNAAGMRDRLIHAYFNIDYQILWDAIENKLPDLKQQIETIIEDIED